MKNLINKGTKMTAVKLPSGRTVQLPKVKIYK